MGGLLEVHQRSFGVCQGAYWGLLGSVGVYCGPLGSVGVCCGICLGLSWDLLGSTPIEYVVVLNVRSL